MAVHRDIRRRNCTFQSITSCGEPRTTTGQFDTGVANLAQDIPEVLYTLIPCNRLSDPLSLVVTFDSVSCPEQLKLVTHTSPPGMSLFLHRRRHSHRVPCFPATQRIIQVPSVPLIMIPSYPAITTSSMISTTRPDAWTFITSTSLGA